MKSEHRHALQTNDLSRFAIRIGHYFERYGTYFFWGVIAIVLAIAAFVYWNRTSAVAAQAGWTEFAAAVTSGTAEDFANVADKFRGTEVGNWARLSEAESYMQLALQLRFTDGEGGIRELERAEQSFETLVKSTTISDAVRERALLGLGKSRESLGKVDEAIEAYGELAGNPKFADSIFREIAAERKEVLQTGDAREFYAWFQRQKPKPEDRSGPRDGMPAMPPGHPPFGSGLQTPELPDLPDSLRLPLTDDDGGLSLPGETPQLPALPETPQSDDLPSLDAPSTPDSAAEPQSPAADSESPAAPAPASPDDTDAKSPEPAESTPQPTADSPAESDSDEPQP
jgi:hypothetical protein